MRLPRTSCPQESLCCWESIWAYFFLGQGFGLFCIQLRLSSWWQIDPWFRAGLEPGSLDSHPSSLFVGCRISEKLLNLSIPQFCYLLNGDFDNSTYPKELLKMLEALISITGTRCVSRYCLSIFHSGESSWCAVLCYLGDLRRLMRNGAH